MDSTGSKGWPHFWNQELVRQVRGAMCVVSNVVCNRDTDQFSSTVLDHIRTWRILTTHKHLSMSQLKVRGK